jgi:ribosomal protein S18 acetylase RimI-like enzyme
MKISVATKSELEIVRNLAFQIWPNTYSSILSKEQLDYMLHTFYDLEYLENQIKENQIFLLVKKDAKYLGFCSYEINYNSTTKTKLHKIYVLPEGQGFGIGKILIKTVENIAQNNANTEVILNVNRYNNALGFYQKIGYHISETVDIEIGNNYLMEDFIMSKKLFN